MNLYLQVGKKFKCMIDHTRDIFENVKNTPCIEALDVNVALEDAQNAKDQVIKLASSPAQNSVCGAALHTNLRFHGT